MVHHCWRHISQIVTMWSGKPHGGEELLCVCVYLWPSYLSSPCMPDTTAILLPTATVVGRQTELWPCDHLQHTHWDCELHVNDCTSLHHTNEIVHVRNKDWNKATGLPLFITEKELTENLGSTELLCKRDKDKNIHTYRIYKIIKEN